MGDKHRIEWLSSSPSSIASAGPSFGAVKELSFPHLQSKVPKLPLVMMFGTGDDVTLAHGVQLGTGSVLATGCSIGSVVTKDVPPYAIVGGVPARVIRKRFDDAVIANLLVSRWWCLPVSAWDNVDPTSIRGILEHLDKIRDTTPELPEERPSINTLMKAGFAL